MADISKINVSGTEYTVKDSNAATKSEVQALKSSYKELCTQTITKTVTEYTLANSRKFSDYVMLVFTVAIGGYLRESCVVQRNVFVASSVGTSLNYTSGGQNVEIVAKYASDTKISMKYNCNETKNVEIWLSGLAIE